MTTVNTTSSSSTAASTLANSSSGKSAADLKTDFLNLLVTQLKNQDPLNPMDNAQMTSQLAQINTVSGIEKLNTTMGTLMTSYANTQNMQAANLIGRTVLTSGNSLPLGASGGTGGGLTLDAAADAVTVTIKDAAGNIVRTESLGAMGKGTNNFSWDGKDKNGIALAQGDYTFA
ncbi:MAG: hypothetical protein RIR18_1150, partial [Pseudomonadota bacterium]